MCVRIHLHDEARWCADIVRVGLSLQFPVSGADLWLYDSPEVSVGVHGSHCDAVIPNGGRVYYLNRSQPPVLTQLVRKYVEAYNVRYIIDYPLAAVSYTALRTPRSSRAHCPRWTWSISSGRRIATLPSSTGVAVCTT